MMIGKKEKEEKKKQKKLKERKSSQKINDLDLASKTESQKMTKKLKDK